MRPESGGRKVEFSSSFEKFKSTSSSSRPTSFLAAAAADMVRRGSRTSDQSSINLVSFKEKCNLYNDYSRLENRSRRRKKIWKIL